MKKLIEQFSRERLEALIDDEDCRATVSEQETFAEIVLALQDAPGKVYQIRKIDGSEEWQQWCEVSATEYYGSVSNEGWGRRILYAVPSDVEPTSTATPAPSEWTNAQCLEFLTTAFRHNKIAGDVAFDDIRLGVKFALATPVQGGSDAN